MSIIIKGATSGNLAEVDSNNNLKVNLPTYLSGSGYSSAVSEVDDGSVLGEKTLRPLDSSQDYRLRTGYDKILWQDTFNHTNVNNSKYIVVPVTQTVLVNGGFLNLNAGNATGGSTVCRVQTYRTFSLFNTYPIYVDLKAKFSTTLQANNVIEFGLGYGSTTTAPTDGIMFRAAGGQLNAVTINNSNETQATNIFTPVPNTVYHFLIVIGQDHCEFWVDDVMVAIIDTPVSFGSPCQSNSLPLFLRNYNTSNVTTAVQLNIAQLGISQGDMDMTKDWATNMVGNGQSLIQVPDGAVAAQTANYANSAAPASITLSNTTSTYAATLLGGQFQFAAVAGAETDYMVYAYLNPQGTASIPGKNLIVTGVRIDTFNTVAAVATTATVFQWSIGVGSTNISLATTDSLSTGARAPRRLILGVQTMPIGTAVGAMATPTIEVTLSSPLIVEPGTYCHIILKMPIGTATATEIYRGTVLVNGYFE